MPARFHLVSPGVWSRTFRNLEPSAKVVAFNVWTCRNRVSEGLYELSPGHVAADTGLTVQAVEAALDQLHAAGIVSFDPEAEVVLDRNALKSNPLRNGVDKDTGEVRVDKRIKGAVDLFLRVTDTPLKEDFLDLADEHSPDLADAIRERLAEIAKPHTSPSEGATKGLQEGASKGVQQEPEGASKGRLEKSQSREERDPREEARHVSTNGEGEKRCEVCGDLIEAGWCTNPACRPPAKNPMFARVAGGAS